uniref:Chromo domain-containing protein n=1 Tax=Strongyloides papillosus TaxID=174720 RepID=A0A0N5BM66_STREA
MLHLNEDSNKEKINRWTKSEISDFQGTSYSNGDNSETTEQSMKKDYIDEKPVPIKIVDAMLVKDGRLCVYLVEWKKKNEDNFFSYVRMKELPREMVTNYWDTQKKLGREIMEALYVIYDPDVVLCNNLFGNYPFYH